MKVPAKFLMSTIAGALIGTSAVADGGLYYGGGLEVASVVSSHGDDFGIVFESEGTVASLSGVIGYEFGLPVEGYNAGVELNAVFPVSGAELEYESAPCSDGAIGPYFCEIDTVIRFRGTISGSFGVLDLGWLAGLGYGVANGLGAVDTNEVDNATVGGLTVGLGVTGTYQDRFDWRAEVIYDEFENILENAEDSTGLEYEPYYEATSIVFTILLGG